MNHTQLKDHHTPTVSLVKLAILSSMLMLLSSALIACQPQTNKEEPNHVELVPVNPTNPDQNSVNTQNTVVVHNTSEDIQPNTQNSQSPDTQLKDTHLTNTQATDTQATDTQVNSQQTNQAAGQANNPVNDNNSNAYPNNTANNPSIYGSQATQITKVEYKNQAGLSMSTTFKTSAVGDLEAQVTLPDGRQMNLIAPQAGGNNPIYESNDGSVVLVSHAGGGSIDLIVNGEPMAFDAISADAEVVTGQ